MEESGMEINEEVIKVFQANKALEYEKEMSKKLGKDEQDKLRFISSSKGDKYKLSETFIDLKNIRQVSENGFEIPVILPDGERTTVLSEVDGTLLGQPKENGDFDMAELIQEYIETEVMQSKDVQEMAQVVPESQIKDVLTSPSTEEVIKALDAGNLFPQSKKDVADRLEIGKEPELERTGSRRDDSEKDAVTKAQEAEETKKEDNENKTTQKTDIAQDSSEMLTEEEIEEDEIALSHIPEEVRDAFEAFCKENGYRPSDAQQINQTSGEYARENITRDPRIKENGGYVYAVELKGGRNVINGARHIMLQDKKAIDDIAHEDDIKQFMQEHKHEATYVKEDEHKKFTYKDLSGNNHMVKIDNYPYNLGCEDSSKLGTEIEELTEQRDMILHNSSLTRESRILYAQELNNRIGEITKDIYVIGDFEGELEADDEILEDSLEEETELEEEQKTDNASPTKDDEEDEYDDFQSAHLRRLGLL